MSNVKYSLRVGLSSVPKIMELSLKIPRPASLPGVTLGTNSST